jgi:DNA polymerase III gamma/tau subunit
MSTTIKIATYPNFDAELREHHDAVRDAETELEQFFAKISGLKGDKIRATIKKMSDSREKSQQLSETVNSNYKKLKDDHDKVIKKAKQVKHINEGLPKRIKESGIAVSTPAQAQKRTAEEADITKPQPQKRQRDESLGEGAVYHERREAPRIPRSAQRETTPKPPTPPKSTGIPSPARKKTAPPAHITLEQEHPLRYGAQVRRHPPLPA